MKTAEDRISPSRHYQAAAASAFPSMVFHGVPPIVTRKTSRWSQTPVVQPRNRVAGWGPLPAPGHLRCAILQLIRSVIETSSGLAWHPARAL